MRRVTHRAQSGELGALASRVVEQDETADVTVVKEVVAKRREENQAACRSPQQHACVIISCASRDLTW